MKIRTFIACFAIIALAAFWIYKYPSPLDHARDELYAHLKSLPPVRRDFNTPEGAILCLEHAYRLRSIDAALAAKDFQTEARLMLQKTDFNGPIDNEMIQTIAEALIVSFRAQHNARWPDFEGLESFFVKRESYADKVVLITQVCRSRNGGFSQHRILVAETPRGWRVLNPVSTDSAAE
jgi:hypothetical protein